jgi:hypothetical protein
MRCGPSFRRGLLHKVREIAGARWRRPDSGLNTRRPPSRPVQRCRRRPCLRRSVLGSSGSYFEFALARAPVELTRSPTPHAGTVPLMMGFHMPCPPPPAEVPQSGGRWRRSICRRVVERPCRYRRGEAVSTCQPVGRAARRTAAAMCLKNGPDRVETRLPPGLCNNI